MHRFAAFLLISLVSSVASAQPQADPPAAAPAPSTQPPKHPPGGTVTVVQSLTTRSTADAKPSSSLTGTAFFAKTPKGTVIGVTSIHFLELDGPPLQQVEWLTLELDEVSSATKAFGAPGRQPLDNSKRDYSADYLLLQPDKVPANVTVLDFDTRPAPRPRKDKDKGEPVWFPYEDTKGFKWVTGEVWSANARHIKVVLDAPLQLQGTSGSPIVSQETGKVIGILSAGNSGDKQSTIFLAPAASVLAAINAAEATTDRPTLAEIDWKKHKAEAAKAEPSKPAPSKK
jgi:hypothetical protein